MKRRTPNLVLFSMLVLPVLGAGAGYSSAVNGGHTPVASMTFVGALWGGFIAALFSLEMANVPPTLRRCAGAVLGPLASAISGLVLGWQVASIIGVGVFAAVLGIFADRWVQHV